MTTQNTAQLRLRRSQRIRLLHPLATAFDWRFVVYGIFVIITIWLAFQAPSAVDIAVGSVGDRLFLQSSAGLSAKDAALWYGDEISADAASGRSRWTRQQAVVTIPAFDYGADVSLMVRMAGWPSGVLNSELAQPQVIVRVNEHDLAVFTPTTAFDDYYMVLPADQNTRGDITIQLSVSDVFTATTAYSDVRPKGVRVERIAVATPNDWVALNIPPLPFVGWSIGFAILLYVSAVMVWRRTSVALVISLLIATVIFTLIAFQRVYVVAIMPYLVALLASITLWQLRSDLFRAWYAIYAVFARGAGMGCGLWVAVVGIMTVVLTLLPIPAFLPHPTWQYLLYAGVIALLVGVGLFAPVAGVLSRLVQWWQKQSAPIFYLVFVAIMAMGVVVMQSAPFIGHADYADNAVVARNLVNGRGWIVDYVTQFYAIYPTVTHPQETWPLLQPVWIAIAFVLFGVTDAAARLPNYFFFALLLIMMWRVSLRIWDGRVGTLAVSLLAVNTFFYRQLEYATTDLAFVAFAFAAVSAVYDIRTNAPTSAVQARWYNAQVVRVLQAGVWTGLMLLQKPGSGGMLAFGMGLWLLYDYRAALSQPLITTRLDRLRSNVRGMWMRMWPVCVWTVVALLCVAPYVEYNLRLYGSPAHTTEQVDAWLLEYTQWDSIYRVYAADGEIGNGDIPDRSWMLRWGFDGVTRKMVNQVGAVRNYLMPSFAQLPAMFQGLGSAPDATGLLQAVWLWAALLGVFVWQSPAHAMIKRLLVAMTLPYFVFMVTYWHANEPRYWVILLPWMALFAATTLVALIDRAKTWFGGRLLAPVIVGLIVLISVTNYQTMQFILQRQRIDQQLVAADRDMYAYLQQQTPLSSVMMTRVPWQLNWYAQRPALMIPADSDAVTLLRLAKHYQVRYLVLDSLQRPNTATRAMIDAMVSNPTYKFVERYRTPAYTVNDRDGTYTMQSVVFEFPADYAGVAEIR